MCLNVIYLHLDFTSEIFSRYFFSEIMHEPVPFKLHPQPIQQSLFFLFSIDTTFLPHNRQLQWSLNLGGFFNFAITHFVVLIQPFVTISDESEGSLVVSDWAALHCPYRIQVGARLTAPFQTGPRTHSPSCTMGTESLLRVKDRGMALTTHHM